MNQAHGIEGAPPIGVPVTRRRLVQTGALAAAAATGWGAASVLPRPFRDRAGAALGLTAAAHLRRARWAEATGDTLAVAGLGALRIEAVEPLDGARDPDGAFLVRLSGGRAAPTTAGTYVVRHPSLGRFSLHLRPAVGRRRYLATIARGGR